MKNTLKMFTFVFVALALIYVPAAKAVSFAPAFESDVVSEFSTVESQPLAYSADYEIARTDAQALPSQQFALTLEDETYLRVTSRELSSIDRPTPNFITFFPAGLPSGPDVLFPTPEPMSSMLFVTGLAGIGLMLRRFVA